MLFYDAVLRAKLLLSANQGELLLPSFFNLANKLTTLHLSRASQQTQFTLSNNFLFSEEGIRVLSLSEGGGSSFCIDA